MLKVPRHEFYELVEKLDSDLYTTIEGISLNTVDDSLLIESFENKVNLVFKEFSEKFPDEDIKTPRECAIIGISNYISAGRKEKKSIKNHKIGMGIGITSMIGSAVAIPIMLESGLDYSYISFIPLVGGFLISSFFSVFYNRNPLITYREKYRNHIKDSYQY